MKFRTEVKINSPIEKVFSYIKDGNKLVKWNSAVKEVSHLNFDGKDNEYQMIRKLPDKIVENIVKISDNEDENTIQIETVSGPTPFLYKYKLVPFRGTTNLILNADVDEEGVLSLLGPKIKVIPKFVINKMVRKAINNNLFSLKVILEA
ncbi:MAG: SRPBCC family protein [Candidatus Lokiarchaeota archaeon]|nr:SRPBCC family protein [Candidatus Lokiarchaeota archaeon]